MGKKAKVVDPIADVRKNPAKVTSVWLNPAASRNAGHGEFAPLPAFPREIFACKNLVELEIFRGLEDGTIPHEIGTFAKLKSLTLGGLDTSVLPETIGNLAKLETLDFSYMESLTALPKTIGKLSKLRELSAPYAGFKALPPEIGKLSALKILNLNDTPLEKVPADLWNATALEQLYFPPTLTSLPPGISKLTKLQALGVSPQALASIADELPKLKSLELLQILGDYSGSSATTLPEQIGSLPKLHTLSASYLGLTSLPASIAKLTKLQELDIGGNKLSTLIDVVAQLPKLEELDYASNPVAVSERRELDKLMKLSPAKRAAALAKRMPPKPAGKPKAKLQRVGQVASINASLSMIIADQKVAKQWSGVGDDLDNSDWERARHALAKKDYAMVDVGEQSAVALSLGIGQGIAHVFKIGERIVVVESIADNTEDELFLEYVASAPQKPRSIANLAVPSKKLVVVPTTDPGAEGLAIAVPAKISISIEPMTKSSWGEARRFFVTPA